MHQSEQLNELFAALSKAQAAFKPALKVSSNPFFKSSYAPLEQIVAVSRGPLSDNNLSVSQPIVIRDDKDVLLTILGHSSGQWICSSVILKPTKADPQSLGSYITYMRRYAYAAIVGIVTDDDDGESAMERLSPEQLRTIRAALTDNKQMQQKIIKGLNIRSLDEIPAHLYEKILERINATP